VPTALRLDLCPASEALTGLRIVEDRVGRVDRVLSVDVSALGRLPVLLYPGPNVSVPISVVSIVTSDVDRLISELRAGGDQVAFLKSFS
jgi:hypothetical protein